MKKIKKNFVFGKSEAENLLDEVAKLAAQDKEETLRAKATKTASKPGETAR